MLYRGRERATPKAKIGVARTYRARFARRMSDKAHDGAARCGAAAGGGARTRTNSELLTSVRRFRLSLEMERIRKLNYVRLDF